MEFEKIVDEDKKKIGAFAEFLDTECADLGIKYWPLDTPDEYFNRPPFCGIFHIKNGQWIYVHQAYPAPGDRPQAWFFYATYDSLDELIETQKLQIAQRIRLENKKNSYIKCPVCHKEIKDFPKKKGRYELRCDCGAKITRRR